MRVACEVVGVLDDDMIARGEVVVIDACWEEAIDNSRRPVTTARVLFTKRLFVVMVGA